MLKDKSKISPVRPCSLNLSYLRPIVWYWTLKDKSKICPVRPCCSNLSYFRPIVWYWTLKDKSKINPIPPCSLNLSYFRPIVWYCILKDRLHQEWLNCLDRNSNGNNFKRVKMFSLQLPSFFDFFRKLSIHFSNFYIRVLKSQTCRLQTPPGKIELFRSSND